MMMSNLVESLVDQEHHKKPEDQGTSSVAVGSLSCFEGAVQNRHPLRQDDYQGGSDKQSGTYESHHCHGASVGGKLGGKIAGQEGEGEHACCHA